MIMMFSAKKEIDTLYSDSSMTTSSFKDDEGVQEESLTIKCKMPRNE